MSLFTENASAVLDRKVKALEAYKSGSAPYDLLSDLLTFIDEKHIVASRVVVKYGREMLKNYQAKLGNEVWDLYEKVFIAAMDSCQNDVKEECLKALKKAFPNSNRVNKLTCMVLESQGEYAAAQSTYEEILRDDAVNMGVNKRLVAVCKEKGDTTGAINALNKYLKVFSSDIGGWQELSDLYLSVTKYELAKFCQEEILLLQPDNYLNHLQYAELMYTLGSKDSLKYARQYYSQSLELKPEGNLRALFGLSLCLRQKGGSTKPIHYELQKWSKNQILDVYKETKENPNPFLGQMVDTALST